MTAATEETNENADFRACLSDLTKIPEKEFERQFRNWMERDEVARELQSKLRCDLITNFNKTSLGKRLIAETTTNRLTLSPMVLALNTLVAEFLYAQNCHFTLSVFCTEVPFRNTLPDFESIRHFRFQETEIFEIMNAICGTSLTDWNVNNKVSKNYVANTSTSLLFFVIKALLEKSAESLQKKVTVGTNTRFIPIAAQEQSTSFSATVQQSERNSKSDIYHLHFRYLNKYLIILSKKVKEMSDQFENLQRQKECCGSGTKQPRVRIFKSSTRRNYEDLNRSLERVTENLKQMANTKRRSKHVDTIVNAIETLASQFEKCAINFENVSKDIAFTPHSSRTHIIKSDKSTSVESLQPTRRPMTAPTSAAASQTDLGEKSYMDWVHEMRYTRNGQRFLDRVEKSLRKAMEKQKQELLVENEVRMRHRTELLRIRYKQKLIEQMYFHGEEHAETAEDKLDLKESISEQFRQFEMKHFDLLSKIFESENESKRKASQIPQEENTSLTTIATVPPAIQQAVRSRPGGEMQSLNLKMTSSTECFEQQQQQPKQTILPENSIGLQQHIREAVDEIVEEERNVNQIVFDAKLRIRELEQESNQLTEHFLGYLERQRKQKLDARDAAQCLWNDYVNEREKMKERYVGLSYKEVDKSKEYENIRNQILNSPIFDLPKDREASDKVNNNSKSSSSSSQSISNFRFKNPILKAKEDFFERERKFKEEAERVWNQLPDLNSCNAPIFEPDFLNRTASNHIEVPLELSFNEETMPTLPTAKKPQALLSNSMIAHLLSDTLSGTGTDFSTLWTTTPRPTTTANVTTAEGAEATTTAVIANGQSNSLIFALTAQRPQNVGVNKSQRREMFSTIAAAAASTELKKQITIPTTGTATATAAAKTVFAIPTPTATITTATTLNKNDDNVEGRSFGANFVDALQATNLHYDYKIKSDYGQKDLQQSERNNNNNSYSNNNNNNYNNSNNKLKALPENMEESNGRNETTTRKAVLQQSMARIQQLFSPHQKQPNQPKQQQLQQHHQQQQLILLGNVAEEDEKNVEVTSLETAQQSNKKATIEEEHESNNQTTIAAATSNRSKNVFSPHKNNLQMQQTTTTATKIVTEQPQPQLQQQQRQQRQQRQQHQHHRQRQQQTPSIEYIGVDDGIGDGNAITITANIRKQQNTTKTSSNGGNKAIEAMLDWQQIGYGATSEKTAFKLQEETAKSTNEVEEVVIEEKDVDSNMVEPGGVVTKDESLAAVGMMSTCKMPEAPKQLEVGELIERGAFAAGTNFTTTLSPTSGSASSSELQLSVGGAGDGARLVKKSLSNRNSAHEVGSDSGSDFWA